MPREFSRSRRVAELIQREMAALIDRGIHGDIKISVIQDDEVGLITISSVDISPDLKNARIYFTCMENTTDIQHIEKRLNEHAGQFRYELSHSLTLRSVPRISFAYDHSLERANKLRSLIDSLHIDKPDSDR